MQISDNLISKLRRFRNGVMESCSMDIQMPVYFIPNSHHCSNATFLNKGYYKKHNNDICLCKNGEDNPDFCILECETCHNEFYLMNTGVKNWDSFSNKCEEKVNTR